MRLRRSARYTDLVHADDRETCAYDDFRGAIADFNALISDW
ncbi:MAG TPA: hypothetical protein VGP27_25345 [Mycobacterium sp.]|jgi:hypothetical protein|nr:hypothetical protein [Mycobacterium sp.]